MTGIPTGLLQAFLSERPRISSLIRRIVGNAAAAEDLTQDTLLRLWHRPFAEADRGMLFATARNLAIDHLRAEDVRQRHCGRAAAAPPQAHEEAPDARVAHRRMIGEIEDALAALPERARRIFLLNRLDGMSYAQIASHLGISVSTVEKDVIRALMACREARAKHDDE